MEEAKLKHGLKPELPDFYNIILERPREDTRGYGLLYVDVRLPFALVHILCNYYKSVFLRFLHG